MSRHTRPLIPPSYPNIHLLTFYTEMAPSVAELKPETAPLTVSVKSVPENLITVDIASVEQDSSVKALPFEDGASAKALNPVEEVVSAKTSADKLAAENAHSKPKIRRVIDEEGGKTTASVRRESCLLIS